MKNVVGPRVRLIRRRKKVTQEQLAARLQASGFEIDQTVISKIETDQRQVTDIELLGICRALDVKVEELFRGLRLPET